MIINPYIFGTEGLGYGYLYNLYAANDSNFAPSDYRIPTWTEFTTLFTTLGGQFTGAGGHMKETGLIHWNTPNTDADNSSGFTARGGGRRSGSPSIFAQIKNQGIFWSSTDLIAGSKKTPITSYDSGNVGNGSSVYYFGLSVRLIYDGAGSPTSVTDYDGNIYDVVQIGSQYWTVQNWKCTHLDNGTALTKITDGTTWASAGSGDFYYCAYDNDEGNV